MKPNMKKLVQEAEIEINKWISLHREKLKDDVSRRLDSRLEELISKYMGFNNHWGKWELDHCNGRQGESAAGDFIKKEVATTCQEWLKKQAGNLMDIKLTANAIASLRSYYIECLEREIRDTLKYKAVSDAQEAVRKMLGEKESVV